MQLIAEFHSFSRHSGWSSFWMVSGLNMSFYLLSYCCSWCFPFPHSLLLTLYIVLNQIYECPFVRKRFCRARGSTFPTHGKVVLLASRRAAYNARNHYCCCQKPLILSNGERWKCVCYWVIMIDVKSSMADVIRAGVRPAWNQGVWSYQICIVSSQLPGLLAVRYVVKYLIMMMCLLYQKCGGCGLWSQFASQAESSKSLLSFLNTISRSITTA